MRSSAISILPIAVAPLLVALGCATKDSTSASQAVPDAGSESRVDAGPHQPEVIDVADTDASSSTGGSNRGVLVGDGRSVDLLLVVDNSISTAPLRQTLIDTVGDLVDRLSLLSLNIGVITTSLGAAGTSGVCYTEQANDGARLLGSRPRASEVPTNAFGFLEYRPGETAPEAVSASLTALIDAAGERGCGYEQPLEAMYRFLVDPAPYATLTPGPCPGQPTGNACRYPEGIDESLLEQRRAFLRPGSVVATIILTNENDCSTRVGGQSWYAMDGNKKMFRGSSACETDPNDTCCYSCGVLPPAGCAEDPVCADPTLPRVEDPANLRCFDQKRRFGVEFLLPTERYVNAFTKTQLCTERLDGDPSRCADPLALIDNPLFASDQFRSPNRVVLAGAVGVPHQLLANSTAADPTELRYMTAEQLTAQGVWSRIAGSANTAPTDPHMRESIEPRPGLPGPAASYLEDPMNGHDFIPIAADELQYACISPLREARSCEPDDPACHCGIVDIAYASNNPTCQAPDGSYSKVEHFTWAAPSIRPLRVLGGIASALATRSASNNAIVTSICTRNASDESRADFAYRPLVDALAERVQTILSVK